MRKGDRPLLPLLLEARDTFATNDRDKIFAMMGLSEQEASDFVPDYSLSITEVFVRFSKHHIEKTGTIDILGACEDHSYRLKKELPSWVPDWEVHAPSMPLSLLDAYASWNTSKNLTNQISAVFSSNNHILTIKGVTVDKVLHVSDSFLEYVPVPGTTRDWLPQLRTDQAKKMMLSISDFFMQQRYRQWEIISRKSKQYSASKDVISAFVRTLTADATIVITDTNTTGPSARLRTIEEIYAAWCKYWNAASQYQGKYISTSYTVATPAELEMATRFMYAHHKAAYGRRFFTSKSHGYMGLCPSLTRKGDMLVILYGGRTPFILRKLGQGKFRFIGECYTHGLMHGEFFNQGDADSAENMTTEYHIV
jgi:hypothetical protein